jgi:hypothetical protein
MLTIIFGVAGGITLGAYALRFLQGFIDRYEVRAFRKRFSDDWDRAYAPARWARRGKWRAFWRRYAATVGAPSHRRIAWR